MKYQDSYAKIKKMILDGSLGKSGTRLLSAQELSAKCGISFVNTLKIMRKLRDEFYLVAIQQKLYIANGPAQKRSDLRKCIGDSKKIGILVPSITNPFFAELTEKTCEYLCENNYIPVLYLNCSTTNSDTDGLNYFLQNKCEGFLVIPSHFIDENIEIYNRFPLPYIVIGKKIPGLTASYVTSENRSTGTLIAKHLTRNGYNKFIYIHPIASNQPQDERLQGFLGGLEIYNAEAKVPTITFDSLDFTWKAKLSAYVESLEKDDKLGIFCYHDLIAFEVYAYLSNAGYQIPQQVGIVGYDNLTISQVYKLTTCSYSYNDITKQAFACLIERIENSNTQNKHIKVQTTLLSRNSTNAN